jgi:glycosyltransferase involved in cell wall biosynthesis
MSAGKPIVANNVDGAGDVVVDGTTGFLVTPQRPAEMAERILYLLRDDALCREMGRVAREQSSYFSKPRMLQEVEHLYQQLHAAARGPQERALEPSTTRGRRRRRVCAVQTSSQVNAG